jgi:hypothetical protein
MSLFFKNIYYGITVTCLLALVTGSSITPPSGHPLKVSETLLRPTQSPPLAAPFVYAQWLNRQNFIAQTQSFATHIEKNLDVPYVWGGFKIGTKKQCAACKKCIIKRKVQPKSRKKTCSPCRKCGLDCSHFVNLNFRMQGIPSQYITTYRLIHDGPKKLLRNFSLVAIPGRNLKHAKAGDLLVYKGHLGYLLAKHDDFHGDFLHVSEFKKDSPIAGGIVVNREVNLSKINGGLRRILRHRSLMDPKPATTKYSFSKPPVTPKTLGPRRSQS